MFGWELPPHNSGGLGVACHGLARAFSDSGTDIIFVLPRKIDVPSDLPYVRFAEGGSLKMKHLDMLLRPYVTSREYEYYRRNIKSDIYGHNLFAEVLRYAEAAALLAEEEEFDVIHAHDWLSFLAGVRVKLETGKPLVVHVHATGFELSGENNVDERIYAIEKEGMEEADCVVTVSERTKNIVTRLYGIDPEKIVVVHNGIKADEYRVSSQENSMEEKFDSQKPRMPFVRAGQKVVLYAGRLTLHKGPDLFLRAARRVLDYEPDTLFIVAGSGDMEGQIIRQSAALGIADHVFFAGFARGEELNKLYYAADLYVLPSVAEPFGMTPLESLVNGTPVLISKQAGVSEALSHALKADFWDVDEMSNKIIMALRYPILAKQLAKYGYLEAIALTWQKAAEKCKTVYNKLVHKD